MQAGVPDIREDPSSGPANHVKHVVRELQALGHQVRVVSLMDGLFWATEDLEHYRPVQLMRAAETLWLYGEKAVRRIQSTFGIPYAAYFESVRFAQACVQELAGFDLLYERMGWMGYGGAMASKRLSIPWVLEVNGDHLDELASLDIAPSGLQRLLSIWLMGRAVNRATHIVAAGDGWRQRFIERWGVDEGRISVVENGSELVELLAPARLRTNRTLQLPTNGSMAADRVNVVYIGAFEPWHGVTTLIKAARLTRDRQADIHIHLIGSGSEESQIRELIDELDLEENVTLHGYMAQNQLAEILLKAEIGVCPYLERANFSGLKILDYKAAGLATLASGRDGQPSVLRHGETGWIVPPGDEQALADALTNLVENPEQRIAMGQTARVEAETAHKWCHTAQQLETIFHSISPS